MTVRAISVGRRLRVLMISIFALILIPLLSTAEVRAEAEEGTINPKIVVRITQLSKTNGEQQPIPGQVYRWEVFGMNFTWDASKADPRPGDAFAITLPPSFQNRQTSGKRVLLTATNVKAGECRLEKHRIFCVLNDNILGYVNIHGQGRAEIMATTTIDSTSTTIIANGETQSIPLPGDHPITEYPAPQYWESPFDKGNHPVLPGDKLLSWSIWFNPSVLAKEWTGTKPITQLIFTDVAGEGHTPCLDTCTVRLDLYRRKDDPTIPSRVVADNRGKSEDGFTLQVTPHPDNAQQFTVVLNGPFATLHNGEANYRIVYQSRVTQNPDGAQAGMVFANSVSLADYPRGRDVTGTTRESLDVTVQMEQGFGGFSLHKSLNGSGKDTVAPNQRYRFLINWTLPEGKTPQDYPGWIAPTANPAEFIIEETGKAVPYPLTFPIGTSITVTEDGTQLPEKVGNTLVQWGTPSYTVGTQNGEGTSPAVMIANKTVSEIAVSNPVSTRATFGIRKGVQGIDTALLGDQKYTFRYECGAENGTMEVPPTNEVITVGKTFAPGTRCTITEVGPAPDHLKNYTFTVPEKQTLVLEAAKDNLASFTNVYRHVVGRFTITKTLSPTTPEDVRTRFGDRTFPFVYDCGAGEVTAKVKIGQLWTSPEFAVGTKCTVKEDVAKAPAIPGYHLVAPQTQTVTIEAGSAPLGLTFVNSYELERAQFTLTKAATGDGAVLAPQKYTFTYTCDPTADDLDNVTGTLEVAPGKPAQVADLPLGHCTLTENAADVDTTIHALTWTLDGNPAGTADKPLSFELSSRGAHVEIGATNTYTRERSAFSIRKRVTGDATFSDDSFEIAYECRVPGADAIAGTVKVPGNGTAVVVRDDLPVGTECAVSESEDTKKRPGFEVQTHFLPVAALRIQKDGPNTVEVTNHYRALVGGFSVEKVVSGDGARIAPASFTFEYTCTTEAGKVVTGEVVVAPGRKETVSNIGVGRCELRERPSLVNGSTLASVLRIGQQAFPDGVAVFNVADQVAVNVLADNTYTLKRGELSVKKVVKGAQEGAFKERSFIIDYTCEGVEDPVKGSMALKGNGESVTIRNLPLGTTCTLQERADSAQLRGYSLTPPAPLTVTISEVTAHAQVDIVNTYTPDKPAPTPPIARTGFNGGEIVGVIAIGLIAVGAGLITVRKRRR